MAQEPAGKQGTNDARVLDPVERLSEILFGLIMAMTFTGAIRAAQAGRDDLKEILFGAIGCNIAWGIVDAVMYLMAELVTRGKNRRALHALRRSASPEQARAILEDALPHGVVRAMTPADFEGLRRWIVSAPESTDPASLTGRAWRGAFGVFLLVTLSTFPVVLPLFFVQDPTRALRTSHAVALVMLFLIGSAFGRYAGMRRPWLVGVVMSFLGVVLALMTIALGG